MVGEGHVACTVWGGKVRHEFVTMGPVGAAGQQQSQLLSLVPGLGRARLAPHSIQRGPVPQPFAGKFYGIAPPLSMVNSIMYHLGHHTPASSTFSSSVA